MSQGLRTPASPPTALPPKPTPSHSGASSVRGNLRLARKHPRYFAHLALKKLQFARRFRWIQRHGNSDRPVPKPLVVKLMLNWKCNLRCPMCMLWGEVGWLEQETKATVGTELPWQAVERVFDWRLPANASFILSGGEPTMYAHFDRLLRRLQTERKFAIICTNGLWLDRYTDALDGNPYPTLLVSLDGPRETNDQLRGKGVYDRVIQNIERLQGLRRPPFIGVQFTVMPENVAHMESFCEEMVARGVDWILLNPGWFLSDAQARRYEQELRQNFDVEPHTHLGYVRTYDYDAAAFEDALRRIWQRRWPIQIASHLKEPEWVQDFIGQPDKILANRLCYKQWLRLDVLPDGKVTPCVQFPDLTVGDLNTQTADEIWHGAENRRFQRFAHGKSLSICAKCDNLYLYNGRGAGPARFRAAR